MLRVLIFIAFCFMTSQVWAQCPEGQVRVKGVRISQGEFRQTQTCFLSIGPRNTNGLVYRNFLFTSRGQMLNFNSFGAGPSSTHTGASEFIFFPFEQNPSYETFENEVVVTMANGSQVIFDIYKGVPLELSGGEISAAPVQRDDVKQGVYIQNYQGLFLDLGFQVGMSPSWFLQRDSVFKDRDSVECKIKNREFLAKKDDEVFYRYQTNQRLKDFLSRRCPRLSIWNEELE